MKSAKVKIVKHWPAAAGIAFAFVLAVSLHLIRSNVSAIADYPSREIGSNEVNADIEIAEGELGLQIAKDLHAAGVTASITSFYQLAIADERALRIAPGTHAISKKISAKQALEQLLDPTTGLSQPCSFQIQIQEQHQSPSLHKQVVRAT